MAALDKIVPETPKAKRLSTVALSGAILAVVWAILDEYTSLLTPAVIVSSITSLVMLVAGFYDFKNKDHDTFEGQPE